MIALTQPSCHNRLKSLNSFSVSLLDPPFNSQASYNVLYREHTGQQSRAQIEAFVDTWHWNDTAEQSFDDVIRTSTDAAELMRAVRSVLRESDLMAYLTMISATEKGFRPTLRSSCGRAPG
jgi:hypothetical protein